MRRWLGVAAVAATAAGTLGVGPAHAQEKPRLVVVKMVDFAFEPARIEVRHGDVLRFVQATASPHNVEFRETPGGTQLDPSSVPSVSATGATAIDIPPPRMGPFLVQKGQTYEFVIGEFFAPGEHEIVCTPHEAMGMKGVIVVEPGSKLGAGGDGAGI